MEKAEESELMSSAKSAAPTNGNDRVFVIIILKPSKKNSNK